MYTLLQHFKDVFPILVALSLAIFTLTQLTVLKKRQWFWQSATTFSLGLTIVYISLVIIDNFSTGYLVCRKGKEDDCGVYPFFYKNQFFLNEWWTVLTSISLIFGWIIFPIFGELMRIEGKLNLPAFKKVFLSKWPYYLCLICSYFAWVLLSFLITRKAKFDIKNFGIIYSNTWSLLVIIPFMSIGLVELPKYLWNRSDPKKYLAHLQQITPKIRKELFDAEMEFSESIALFVDIIDQLDLNDECYDLANHIYNTSPEFKYGPQLLPSSQFNHPLPITSNYITSVYNKITSLKHTQSKLQTQWNNHLKTSFLVEDVVGNLYSSDHRLTSSLKILTGDRMENFKLSISWWYNVYLFPVSLKVLSVLSFILGIVIVWSEITFTVTNPTLSIIAILFERINGNYNIQNCITLIILPYMFLATIFGLLSIKPFKHYSITINRQNDLHSIFWICMQLVTIAPTLIYNYVTMAQMGDYGKHPIVFNHMYSYFMDSAAFLGKYFNYYLPLVIGVFVILIVFKLHISLLKLINLDIIEYYSGLECAKVDGRGILASERSKREREFQPINNISENNFNRNPHNIATN